MYDLGAFQNLNQNSKANWNRRQACRAQHIVDLISGVSFSRALSEQFRFLVTCLKILTNLTDTKVHA